MQKAQGIQPEEKEEKVQVKKVEVHKTNSDFDKKKKMLENMFNAQGGGGTSSTVEAPPPPK